LRRAGQSEPRKLFERHASLNDTQIINYKASANEKWCVLIGIKAEVRARAARSRGAAHLACRLAARQAAGAEADETAGAAAPCRAVLRRAVPCWHLARSRHVTWCGSTGHVTL
jgi:hypothetical protein